MKVSWGRRRRRQSGETKNKNKTTALKIQVSLEPLTEVDQDSSADPKHKDCPLRGKVSVGTRVS